MKEENIMDKIINALETLRISDADFFGVGYETQKAYERVNDNLDECIELIKTTEQPIYEVLVYSELWHVNELGFFDFGTEERVGFYYEKETAIRAIEENWCNIQDHYAKAAAIRTVLPGLYQDPPLRKYLYYVWNSNMQKWIRSHPYVPVEAGDFC